MAFARALGEYGSVVFIAGNMPMHSEITPLLIITKLEQYDYRGATAIAVVLLVASFTLLLLINLISRVMLLAAAWAATTAEGRGHLATGEATTGDAPLAGDRRTPVGPREASLPSFGQRASDRTTLAAGVVLGVSAAAGARTVRHGLRAAVAAARGR